MRTISAERQDPKKRKTVLVAIFSSASFTLWITQVTLNGLVQRDSNVVTVCFDRARAEAMTLNEHEQSKNPEAAY